MSRPLAAPPNSHMAGPGVRLSCQGGGHYAWTGRRAYIMQGLCAMMMMGSIARRTLILLVGIDVGLAGE